jgi:hypothetical protein
MDAAGPTTTHAADRVEGAKSRRQERFSASFLLFLKKKTKRDIKSRMGIETQTPKLVFGILVWQAGKLARQ